MSGWQSAKPGKMQMGGGQPQTEPKWHTGTLSLTKDQTTWRAKFFQLKGWTSKLKEQSELHKQIGSSFRGLEPSQKLRMVDLRDQFDELGAPPWNGEQAMTAAAIKATLDFESLPFGDQGLQHLKGKGQNPSFWINKQDGFGGTEKSFLFKLQGLQASVEGFPPGGETAREALAGRLGDILHGMTGIDVRMPETQIISVDPGKFPSGTLDPKQIEGVGRGEPIVGSLQQFAQTKGEMRDLPFGTTQRVSNERCQELTVLDLIALNCDRHGGNFLMKPGEKGTMDLVPIDHGLTFPTRDVDFKDRMTGRQNSLLSLPGAHEPFSPKMLERIQAIDPQALVDALRKERDTIGTVHRGTENKVSDESLELSRRSAMFLKLAAPYLSPAAVQEALARNAQALFEPALTDDAFTELAQQIVDKARAPGRQEALKEYYLASPEEVARRETQMRERGWIHLTTIDKMDPNTIMKLYKLGNPPDMVPEDLSKAQINKLDKREVNQFLKIFPNNKVNLSSRFPKWEAFKQLGGEPAIEQACQEYGLSEQVKNEILQDCNRSVAFLRDLANLKSGFDEDNAEEKHAGEARYIGRKIEYLRVLKGLLPENEQAETAGEIDRIEQALAGGLDPKNAEMREKVDRLRDSLIDRIDEFQKGKIDQLQRELDGLRDEVERLWKTKKFKIRPTTITERLDMARARCNESRLVDAKTETDTARRDVESIKQTLNEPG